MRSASFREVHADALAEIAQLAGVGVGDVFLYSEHPTKTSGRWFFQSWVGSVPEVNRVCLSAREAAETVNLLLVWCRAHPDEARTLAVTGVYRPERVGRRSVSPTRWR